MVLDQAVSVVLGQVDILTWMRVSSSGVPESRSLGADGLLTVSIAEGTLTSEMIELPIDTPDSGPRAESRVRGRTLGGRCSTRRKSGGYGYQQ